MSIPIIPQTRPARSRRLPLTYDPYRRLLAAIAAQAVIDVLWPKSTLTQSERESARLFIRDQPELIADLSNTTPEVVFTIFEGGQL